MALTVLEWMQKHKKVIDLLAELGLEIESAGDERLKELTKIFADAPPLTLKDAVELFEIELKVSEDRAFAGIKMMIEYGYLKLTL